MNEATTKIIFIKYFDNHLMNFTKNVQQPEAEKKNQFVEKTLLPQGRNQSFAITGSCITGLRWSKTYMDNK